MLEISYDITMTIPKVSVIIPVYKAQETIRKCLDSFINQSLAEWEMILVDDGSPDESGRICDEYVKRDSRISVIHQSNAGVSAARQAGLDSAHGEYIIHADPDDWVEPQMLKELYGKACETNADMTICDWIIDIGGKTEYRQQRPSSLLSSAVLDDVFTGNLHGSCCNKLVKHSCIEQCNAVFPQGINYCEDVCFNVQLLKHNIKIAYLNRAFYHYVQSQSSITNHYTIESLHTQKKYVAFLASCLPEDSSPVVLSKEYVKKMAFLYAVIGKKELALLYPEIRSVHENKRIMKVLYSLAFSGHYHIASLMRDIYRNLKKHNHSILLSLKSISETSRNDS